MCIYYKYELLFETNRIDQLPHDIINHIYFKLHQLKMKELCKQVELFKLFIFEDGCYYTDEEDLYLLNNCDICVRGFDYSNEFGRCFICSECFGAYRLCKGNCLRM